MRTSCRASWQSPSWSSQCFQSFRSYFGMSVGTGAMVIIRVVDGTSAGVEVRFAGAWVGDTVGSVGAPVGEIPGVAGVDAGVDAPFVAVNAGVGPGVGIPGACVGTGVGSGGGDGVARHIWGHPS